MGLTRCYKMTVFVHLYAKAVYAGQLDPGYSLRPGDQIEAPKAGHIENLVENPQACLHKAITTIYFRGYFRVEAARPEGRRRIEVGYFGRGQRATARSPPATGLGMRVSSLGGVRAKTRPKSI